MNSAGVFTAASTFKSGIVLIFGSDSSLYLLASVSANFFETRSFFGLLTDTSSPSNFKSHSYESQVVQMDLLRYLSL